MTEIPSGLKCCPPTGTCLIVLFAAQMSWWMVSNPEIVAKQAKARQAKERVSKAIGKRKQNNVDATDNSEIDIGSP